MAQLLTSLIPTMPSSPTRSPSSPMNRKVVLNDDVLFLILQELSSISETNTDLLAVMQTCRTFHRLGMKVFLCRKVILRTEETVASFCDALSADNYSRAPMLRDLHWECGAISQPTSKALCSLLPHATLLQDVYVEDLDLLLDCVPELNHVLANMECLRRLSVVLLAPTTAILAFFSTFRSQLTDLDIKFHAISAEDPSEVVWDVDLLRQLHPFALTLDHLSVDHLSMRSCASIVFPNVTVLEMDAVFLPSVDILARAFPRLRELEVFGAWWNEDASRSDVDVAVARRGAHLAAQERHRSWCELRKVSGGLVDILALGLTCPVSALALEVSESTFDRRSVGEMLRRLLGDTPKLRDLQLATTVDIFELRRTQNMDGNGLWGLMDIDATLEVQYIYINYAVQSLYRIFSAYAELLKAANHKLQALTLEISIPCPVRDCWDRHNGADLELDTAPSLADPSLCPIWQAFHQCNLHRAIAVVLDALPSLHNVQLNVYHNLELVRSRAHCQRDSRQ